MTPAERLTRVLQWAAARYNPTTATLPPPDRRAATYRYRRIASLATRRYLETLQCGSG